MQTEHEFKITINFSHLKRSIEFPKIDIVKDVKQIPTSKRTANEIFNISADPRNLFCYFRNKKMLFFV